MSLLALILWLSSHYMMQQLYWRANKWGHLLQHVFPITAVFFVAFKYLLQQSEAHMLVPSYFWIVGVTGPVEFDKNGDLVANDKTYVSGTFDAATGGINFGPAISLTQNVRISAGKRRRGKH